MSTKVSSAIAVCAALWLLALCAGAAESADADVAAAIERQDYAAAAKLLRGQLASGPEDQAVRFTLARVLAWSGDYDGAISEYDALLAASPADVDYSFGRAQALAWAGRDEAALDEVARARALAPDYEDVWRLELSLLERDAAASSQLQQFREQAARRFPSSDWWREPEARAPADVPTQLTAGAVQQSLSTSAPDWSTRFIQVSHRRQSGGSLYATITQEGRFGEHDSVLVGGGDWKASEHWTVGAELGLAPQADFVPRHAATVWALRALPRGWETELRLRYRDYSDATVTMTGFTFARYFGDFRAAYGLDLAELDGEATSAAHSATLNYYRSARTQFNFSVVEGQEAESTGPHEVLRTDVSGFAAGGKQALGERWSLAWWVGSTRQGDLYRRRYVGIALTAGL
jgi:YaiO family outer membrane protein